MATEASSTVSAGYSKCRISTSPFLLEVFGDQTAVGMVRFMFAFVTARSSLFPKVSIPVKVTFVSDRP